MAETIGKYELIEKHTGGMAVVYKARDPDLERNVAIKRIARDYSGNEEYIRRFRQEARTLARINHPGIVQIYEFLREEGQLFIVMEYVEGRSLEEMIGREISWREAADILQQSLQALKVVHEEDIIHRDLKPSNILYSEEGQVKIMDFGVAKGRGEDPTEQVGTARYMPPEIIDTEMTGPEGIQTHADIYSLGLVIYELLLGTERMNELLPEVYSEETGRTYRWMKWHGNFQKSLPPMHTRDPSISKPFSRLVQRMIEKDPDRRPSDAGELLEKTRRVLAGDAVQFDDVTTADSSRSRERETATTPTGREPETGSGGEKGTGASTPEEVDSSGEASPAIDNGDGRSSMRYGRWIAVFFLLVTTGAGLAYWRVPSFRKKLHQVNEDLRPLERLKALLGGNRLDSFLTEKEKLKREAIKLVKTLRGHRRHNRTDALLARVVRYDPVERTLSVLRESDVDAVGGSIGPVYDRLENLSNILERHRNRVAWDVLPAEHGRVNGEPLRRILEVKTTADGSGINSSEPVLCWFVRSDERLYWVPGDRARSEQMHRFTSEESVSPLPNQSREKKEEKKKDGGALTKGEVTRRLIGTWVQQGEGGSKELEFKRSDLVRLKYSRGGRDLVIDMRYGVARIEGEKALINFYEVGKSRVVDSTLIEFLGSETIRTQDTSSIEFQENSRYPILKMKKVR